MKRSIAVFGLLMTLSLAGCGPESVPGAARPEIGAPSQVEATPLPVATVELETVAATSVPDSKPTPGQDSAVAAEPDQGHAPSPLPTPTATIVPVDSFPMAVSPTSVPTPDVNKVTIPELDEIEFVNRRPLLLPEGSDPNPIGWTVWSPDGQEYLAQGSGSESIMIGSVQLSLLI